MFRGSRSPVPPAAIGAGSWSRARLLVLVGALLSLGIAAAVAAYLVQARQERLQARADRIDLVSRVLQDHASRSIDTAALALAALGDRVARTASPGAGQGAFEALTPVLTQSLAGMPVVRDIAVLDRQGLVLAGTEAELVGRQLDLRPMGPLPAAGADRLGSLVDGRGLQRLVPGIPAAAVPAGLGFLPLTRALRLDDGRELLVVAVVNPDAIANHQQQVLADLRAVVLLCALDGRVLAATESAALAPGETAAALPVFTRYLPDQEHGQYQGAGAGPGEQLVAFRATRTWPLVVVVETAVDDALAPWRRESGWLGGMAMLAVAFTLLTTALAARSMQARELARAQRDAAQAEVQRREAELSVVVASVQELLFRTDAEGRLVYVNPRWPQATGLTEAQTLGQPLAQLARPESAGAVQRLFSPEGHAAVRSATLRMGQAQERREYEVAVAPLREGGRITGFAGSAIDVTATRQAQARLKAQLGFTELLLDMLPLPMSIRDMQGRYVSVNQAWLALSGRRREAVLGQPAQRFYSDDDARLHEQRDRELVAQGDRLRYEAHYALPDGSRRDVVVTKALVPGDDGQPAGIISLMLDVSEMREAERATREARDAAEEASRAKTEFIANISHELRTPLQSIIGFSELGQARAGEARRLGAMFGDIHAAGQRMLALVNDLLDVAKIESTVGTFHLERADVRSLVRTVAGELAPQLQRRSLQLTLDLGAQPLVAKVDPLRFEQVVRNVLANAVRFSPEGTSLHVSGVLEPAGHIHLAVRDQGPGIPPAELDQIFDAFVQSSKTKDGSGGTGLGLAISRKIMQAHGGEISATNNADGEGATFHIRLPARGSAETRPAEL